MLEKPLRLNWGFYQCEYNLKMTETHALLTMLSSQQVMMSLDWYTVNATPVLRQSKE